MTIGQNIRKRRIEMDMSQQQLANAIGYKTRSSIAKIEKGETDVAHSKLVSFANVLNTSVEFLLTGARPELENEAKSVIVTAEQLPGEPGAGADGAQMRTPTKYAVILAGGKSTRNQQNTPNQFVSVMGKPVILYALEAYQHHPAISEIYIVCLAGWEGIVPAYAKQHGITKLAGIIPAGKTGMLSCANAVDWLSQKCSGADVVIFQEATRPMVTADMISNVIQCCHENASAITFEPMDEYLQFLTQPASGAIVPVDRNRLISVQSPEAYRFGFIQRAILDGKKAQHDFAETCCALYMHNMGKQVAFCEGNRYNLKIVRQEDLHIFEALLSMERRSAAVNSESR